MLKNKKIERRLNFLLSNNGERTMLMKNKTSLPKIVLTQKNIYSR